jgi:hypothetical protein
MATESPYLRGKEWMKLISSVAPVDEWDLKKYLGYLEETTRQKGAVHIELDYYDIFNFCPDEGEVYPIELLKKQLCSIPQVHLIQYRSADGSYGLENGEIIKNGWK